jgi:hypothetical protein
MGQKLNLDVPDEVYRLLAEAAQRWRTTPEEVAVEWLAGVGLDAANDPVESFLGALRTDGPLDWADAHDQHLGQALMDELGGQDAGGT